MDFGYKSFDKFTRYAWMCTLWWWVPYEKWDDCRIKYSAFIKPGEWKKKDTRELYLCDWVFFFLFVCTRQPKSNTWQSSRIQCHWRFHSNRKTDNPSILGNCFFFFFFWICYHSSLFILHVHIKGNWLLNFNMLFVILSGLWFFSSNLHLEKKHQCKILFGTNMFVYQRNLSRQNEQRP